MRPFSAQSQSIPLMRPVFILFLTGLTACGSANKYYDTEGRSAVRQTMRESSGEEAEEAPASDVSDKRRLIIYTADLRVSVSNHLSALDQAASVAKSAGGFVESSETSASVSESRITLRVPRAKFQETVQSLAALGTVIDRNISASDVTREFLDTENRIALSRTARDRLYVLLKRVTDMKERVRILQEIDRLTSEIDALTARSTYLRSRGDFSTITASFVSAGAPVAVKRPSPFAWVRSLSHRSRSIFDAEGVSIARPAGFFDYASAYYPRFFGLFPGTGDSVYSSPDGMLLRAGTVHNYPKGSLEFWRAVLERDLVRRGYEILETRREGSGWLIRMRTAENLNITHFTVFILVNEKYIHVAEGVLPGKDPSAGPALQASLVSLKGK